MITPFLLARDEDVTHGDRLSPRAHTWIFFLRSAQEYLEIDGPADGSGLSLISYEVVIVLRRSEFPFHDGRSLLLSVDMSAHIVQARELFLAKLIACSRISRDRLKSLRSDSGPTH